MPNPSTEALAGLPDHIVLFAVRLKDAAAEYYDDTK